MIQLVSYFDGRFGVLACELGCGVRGVQRRHRLVVDVVRAFAFRLCLLFGLLQRILCRRQLFLFRCLANLFLLNVAFQSCVVRLGVGPVLCLLNSGIRRLCCFFRVISSLFCPLPGIICAFRDIRGGSLLLFMKLLAAVF